MAICIYPPNAEDFSTNGLGILTPIECTISEQGGGKYQLNMVHPIDPQLRWAQIQNGCIIKAPVPVRESPLYEETTEGESIVTREVYKVVNTYVGVYFRTGPGMGYKALNIQKNGALAVKLDQPNDSWMHVCLVDGGAVGYMSTKYLALDHVETETINPEKAAGKVIRAEQSREQLFRIASVETDTDEQTVTATAMHVFYDLRGNLIDGDYAPEGAEAATAVKTMVSMLANDTPFTFHSDGISGKVTGEYSYLNPVEALLDPDQGIAMQAGALLVRDNFDVHLLPDATRDRGVTIRRGKNLIGVAVTTDATNVVTRIIPAGKDKDGKAVFLEGTKYVDSPRIDDYPIIYTRRIEYDVSVGDEFKNVAAVRAEIKRLAEEDFSANGIDLPAYGMEVDFVLLQNTAEYANYASLEAVHLYDAVTVIDSLIGLKAKLRVTGYEWDALARQYNSVTLGELQSLEQMVYSYNLPTGGVSGTKIMPNTLSGTALRNASIEYAKIAIATIQQLNAESITALTARLEEIISESITTDELYVALADISRATIETAEIDWASITELSAVIASLTQAKIDTADIDFAHIKDLATDTAIITEGVGGQLYISRLAVTEANMVSLTTGELVVKGEDGSFYSVSVDANGNIQTTIKQIDNNDVKDLSLNAGEKLIEGSVTAACLNAREIFADNAIVRELIAANLDVDTLFAREAFINRLMTTKIIGDKTLTMIVEEQETASRTFRQESFPTGDDLVRPNDLLIIPSTGQTYQAVDMSGLNLKFYVDGDGNLHYSLDGGADVYGFEFLEHDLYAEGLAFTLNEDGSWETPYAWVRVQDKEMLNAIDSLIDTVDGKTTTWYQDERPTNAAARDIWYDTDAGRIYRYDGSTWTDITTNALKAALDAAATAESAAGTAQNTANSAQSAANKAQDTADGKIVTFAQASAPVAAAVGDLWIDTDNDNMLYRWDGTAWRPYRDQLILSVQNKAEFATVYDSETPPETAPETGKLWLDRSLVPPLLRRWLGTGADTSSMDNWEVVNDTATIEAAQAEIAAKQAALEAEQRNVATFLKLDFDKVRIGKEGVTSEVQIDPWGMGVAVKSKVFSRFEADRVRFGNMEMRQPAAGGLMLDAIDITEATGVSM